MYQILAIGLGGMAGTLTRYYVQNWAHSFFPNALVAAGTLTVNMMGCFFIGLCSYWMQAKGLAGTALWMFLITGVMGGFTTFSTFGLESFQYLKSGMTLNGIANIVVQVTLGLTMVWAGEKLAEIIL